MCWKVANLIFLLLFKSVLLSHEQDSISKMVYGLDLDSMEVIKTSYSLMRLLRNTLM